MSHEEVLSSQVLMYGKYMLSLSVGSLVTFWEMKDRPQGILALITRSGKVAMSVPNGVPRSGGFR